MNLLAPVSSIMSTDLVTVGPNDSLEVVNRLFKKHNIHHLLVTHRGELKGIISKSDFYFFRDGYTESGVEEMYERFRLRMHKASEIMTTKLAKMQSTQKVDIALAIFTENLFHAIPVMNENDLVGIVTTFDIIRTLYKDKQAMNTLEVA